MNGDWGATSCDMIPYISIGIIAIACGLSINAGTALAANET